MFFGIDFSIASDSFFFCQKAVYHIFGKSDKMTQKLIDEGYIIKEPYREITLTSEGIKAANELYTPSVILQDFLENRVGVERKNAENDSVAIVSQISDDALDKLVSFALQSTTNG